MLEGLWQTIAAQAPNPVFHFIVGVLGYGLENPPMPLVCSTSWGKDPNKLGPYPEGAIPVIP
jgi:hypothetical protein